MNATPPTSGARAAQGGPEAGRGNPLAPGAVPAPGGVDFSVFSRHATGMILCLYDDASDTLPARELRLDPAYNRTGDIWHCHVPGLAAGALYLWRAEGPFRPKDGFRFNPNRVLLDPYAKALTDGDWDLAAARAYIPDAPDLDLSFATERNDAGMPKCIVIDDDFDWCGDMPLNYPLKDCVIYETHVRGLTRGPGAGVEHPGSYRGVIETIPHFRRLGITSLEFLPVQEFDGREPFRRNPSTGKELSNYWGYSTLAFFAPKASYAHVDGEVRRPGRANTSAGRTQAQGAPALPHDFQVREFKTMVRELHSAGIEVILDVVFNHSAEGNERGPTLSFRGLDNTIYYMLEPDRRRYKNYSGCGNTLNCNHPVTRTLIQECLRYWVVQMHVDGFRFDLGSILGRNAKGELLENPPVIESIAEDPILRDTKIIAEAWDAGGAYQVGAFPGGRWAEWNDRYRDDVRRFWAGAPAGAVHLATRITGSSDLYLRDGRKPFHSINFVTAHDGFTLNDLVTYSTKHNEANGEGNRDGADFNLSANFGVEGPDAPPSIRELRNRQVKNYLATLLLSIGTPMLLGGDEFRRSQDGNNNAYCQDNTTSWYDWRLATTHADILRFASGLIRFRLRHPAFRRPEFFTGEDSDRNDMPDITWFDERGKPPDWSALDSRIAARIDGSRVELAAHESAPAPEAPAQNAQNAPRLSADSRESDIDDADFFLMFNASDESAAFTIPPHPRGRTWLLVLDTAQPSPGDFVPEDSQRPLEYQQSYALAPWSMVALLAKP